jgi:hypothetical protein
MPDEHQLTLLQIHQARDDLSVMSEEFAVIQAQLALLPTRKELARIALGVIFGTAGQVIGWPELFWRT